MVYKGAVHGLQTLLNLTMVQYNSIGGHPQGDAMERAAAQTGNNLDQVD